MKKRQTASKGITSDHESDDGVPEHLRKKRHTPQKHSSTSKKLTSSKKVVSSDEASKEAPPSKLVGMTEPRKHRPSINIAGYFKEVLPISQSTQHKSPSPTPNPVSTREETPSLFLSQNPESKLSVSSLERVPLVPRLPKISGTTFQEVKAFSKTIDGDMALETQAAHSQKTMLTLILILAPISVFLRIGPNLVRRHRDH